LEKGYNSFFLQFEGVVVESHDIFRLSSIPLTDVLQSLEKDDLSVFGPEFMRNLPSFLIDVGFEFD
jgi:hypothetical protein